MKKLFAMLLAVLLMLAAVPALAATWDNPAVTSPYKVAIIPVRQRTVFGQTYTEQYFGAAAAGDDIRMAIRVEVPDKPRGATLTVKAQNCVLDCVLTATLPMTQGVYYLKPTGDFGSDVSFVGGYCTGVPTVTASITGTEQVTSVGQYSITRSDGYIVSSAGRGMSFHTDATGKIYTAYAFNGDGKYKLTSYLLTEDSEAGVICRDVLRVLGMDGAALLNGSVYMTDRVFAANFGILVDTEVSKTWGVDAVQTTALPVSTITDVPATGEAGELFVCGGIIAMVAIAFIGFRKRDKHEKHS